MYKIVFINISFAYYVYYVKKDHKEDTCIVVVSSL